VRIDDRNQKVFFFVSLIIFIISLFSFSQTVKAQQSAEKLYEEALFKKNVEGDLRGAMELFTKILSEFPDNRITAAEAQLQIGICSEKLGLKEEAKKAFQKVMDEYPDQFEAVRLARQNLSSLEASISQKKESTEEIILKKMEVPFGVPSPDGKYISYIDWSTGDLSLYEMKTGKTQRLTRAPGDFSEFALEFVWSPDSEMLAYQWNNKDGIWGLRVVDRHGNLRTAFSDENREVSSIAGWSADQEIIFLVRRKNSTKSLVGLSIDNNNPRGIKNFGDTYIGNMRISPDGKYLAFDFEHGDNCMDSDINVISFDEQKEISIIKHPAYDSLLEWTPDGNHILFSSTRTGDTGIWSISVSNGEPEKSPVLIKENMGLIIPLGMTKDGKLYYSVSRSGGDAYISKINKNTGEILTPPKRVNPLFQGRTLDAFWSPDGKYLAYFIRRSNLTTPFNFNFLRIRALETGREKEISLGFKANIFSQLPRWSPEGKFIFLTGQEKKKSGGFYKLNVQTGESELILERPIRAWSQNGEIVYEMVSNPREKLSLRKHEIFRTDLQTKEKNKVLQIQEPCMISRLTLSPNGKWLGFIKDQLSTKPSVTTINVVPAQGGEIIELLRNSDERINIYSFSWGPSSQDIFFTKMFSVEDGQEEKKGELWYIPSFEGASPRKTQLEMYRIRRLSFHPDGQRMVFNSEQSSEYEVWVMENFMKEEKIKQTKREEL